MRNDICPCFQYYFPFFTVRSETTINIRPAQGAGDAAHSYFSELITTILNRTSSTYGLAKVNVPVENLTQNRSLRLLKEGRRVDLNWAGINLKREQDLRPIRIPLNMGLLGYRLLVIRQDRLSEFDQIRTPDQLNKLIACQGQYWPDSDIIEDNGYIVN
ncbi:hypothetical protein [Kiloniella sp.]|uniref:hypothetical protein n=1 Tax=Kiloniella sp. TaxID=1938587 RepID=UPI003A8FD373